MSDSNFYAPPIKSDVKTDTDDDPVYQLHTQSQAPDGVDSMQGFSSLTGWGEADGPNSKDFTGRGAIDGVVSRVDVPPEQATVIVESKSLTSSPQIAESKIPSFGSAQEIEVDKIFPNPFQPRKTFDPTALQELADSIKEHGVIQPVVVTRTPAGFELVVGERRFRASVLAGLARVPAIVKEGMADITKLEVALIENIQRHELNPIEEAHAYDRLVKGFNLTQEQIARKLGKSRPAVTNTLRLLNLPAEIQRSIIEGKLAEGHARPLLSIIDRSQQLALFRKILEKGLNTRQIEAEAREIVQRKSIDGLAPDPKLMAMETKLRGTLGTSVRIQRVGRGGKIMIEFFSEEELEDIIKRMGNERVAVRDNEEYLTV